MIGKKLKWVEFFLGTYQKEEFPEVKCKNVNSWHK